MKKTNKFGIMTFHSVRNYGAVLQALALQHTVESLGYEAEHLRFIDNHQQAPKDSSIKKIYNICKSSKLNFSVYMNARRTSKETDTAFERFRNKYLHRSRKAFYSVEDLQEEAVDYTGYISGSDMVWSDIGQCMEAYYLTFTHSEKRIAYAPSLTGTSSFSEEKKQIIAKWISEFSHLSVREKSGADFIKRMTGISPFVAVDPTLLLDVSEWRALLSIQAPTDKQKYILVYMFQGARPVMKQIQQLSKSTGYEIRYIPMTMQESFYEVKSGRSAIYDPQNFVEMVFNASFVITNSFHGMLFSLIGNVPFAIIHRENTNQWKEHEARIQNILDSVHLEDRFLEPSAPISLELCELDYEKINTAVGKMRAESRDYLKGALADTAKINTNIGVKKAKNNIAEIAKGCTGCGLCEQVCPTKCVTMSPNKEGFLYPVINEIKCIHCNKCINSCPQNNAVALREPMCGQLGYAQDELLKDSASGGAFLAMARYFIEELKGVVCGAILDDATMKCTHILTETMSGVQKMQGSKYIQSEIRNCFQLIKYYLESGRFVLFSGTPCQVAAIQRYLSKEYDNLLTMDLICHGVPSPLFWQLTTERLVAQYGKVNEVKFRTKEEEAKTHSAFKLNFIDGNGRKQVIPSHENAYYNTFVNCSSYRESCYYCDYAGMLRCSDITVGDCDSWKDYPAFSPEKAKSTILVNTDKGKLFMMKIDTVLLTELLDVDAESSENVPLSKPSPRGQGRDEVYEDMQKLSPKGFENKYSNRASLMKKLISKMRFLKNRGNGKRNNIYG